MRAAMISLLLLSLVAGGCQPAHRIVVADIYADSVPAGEVIPALTEEITLQVEVAASPGAEVTVLWYYLDPDFILHEETAVIRDKHSTCSFSFLRPLEGWLPGNYAAAVYLQKRRDPEKILYFTLKEPQ